MLQNLLISYELMFWHLIIGTFILLAFWLALYRGRGTEIVVTIGSALFIVAAPVMYLLYLFTLVSLTVVWRMGKIRPWRFIPVAATAMLLIQAYFAAPYVRRFHELEALRDNNPPVSLVDRLAHESRISQARSPMGAANAARAGDTSPQLAADVELELERVENRLERVEYAEHRHEGSLETLSHLSDLKNMHSRLALEFYLADGFGVIRARIFDLNQEAFAVPDLPDLKLPPSAEPEFESSPDAKPQHAGDLAQARAPKVFAPDLRTLRETHEAGAVDFVNRAGFGFVVSPDRVFGFQSHGFRTRPQLTDADNGPSTWKITTLQLVSLLKHETPAAYLSDSLPRMDKLVDVPIRALDDYEVDALAKLRAGEQIVVEPGSEEIRMLGSLRAAKQCRQCHSVPRGDLLGAFTYRLRRSTGGSAAKKPLL